MFVMAKVITRVFTLSKQYYSFTARTVKAIAVVGQRKTLPCNSSVQKPVSWWYKHPWGGEEIEIVVDSQVVNGYSSRMSLVDYDLIIHNALLNDIGVYTCVEETGFGEHHKISLRVSGSFAFTVVRALFFFTCRK